MSKRNSSGAVQSAMKQLAWIDRKLEQGKTALALGKRTTKVVAQRSYSPQREINVLS